MFVQRFKVISRQRATKPIPTQGMPGVVSRAIVFSIRIGGSEIVGRVIVWTPTLILSFLLLFKQIYHSFKLPRDFRNIKRQSFSTLREKEIWKNRQDLIFSSQNSNPEIFLFIEMKHHPSHYLSHSIFVRNTKYERRPYYFPRASTSLPFRSSEKETGLKNETTKEENEKKGEEKRREREREREVLNDGGRSSPRLRKARATFAR